MAVGLCPMAVGLVTYSAVPYGGGAGDLHLDRPMTLKVMGRSTGLLE